MDGSRIVWHLSAAKAVQAKRRGWTNVDIDAAIHSPVETAIGVNRATGNRATYHYRGDGHYIVRDDITAGIVQMSDRHDPEWIDELTQRPVYPRSR